MKILEGIDFERMCNNILVFSKMREIGDLASKSSARKAGLSYQLIPVPQLLSCVLLTNIQ